ncbi:MAG: polysaccharide pyruvyl transferase family protein [Clostridiales bacterium]|jgi:hypothetical protein|nr:polysaccharide pyruvyl transferase family protein [Clostridiales bacterium]
MNKKKVGIVTIISKNYGNRLQNYALQEYLKKLEFDVYTLPYKTKFRLVIKESIRLFLIYLFKYCRNRWVWEDFNRKYIKWTPIKSQDSYWNNRYDYFVAGSDQIWNPLFWINSEREFLRSYSREKRITYAASIGIDQLPIEYHERYKGYLNEIPNISVRETKAADIVYTLTGKRVPIVIDPTMLITRKEWEAFISSCSLELPSRYIVNYILGAGSSEYIKLIKIKAKTEGLEIIDLLDEKGNTKRKIGPREFIYIISHSERTYVDSFHGAVFSILFSKPFAVFERPYEEGAGLMTSRLDSLLSTFRLTNRMVKSIEQLEKLDDYCDFSQVGDILKAKRREALSYLMKAFNLEEEVRKNENRES